TVHASRWAFGNRLVHHTPRQGIVLPAHAFPHVEQPLQVDDALPDSLQLFDTHVEATHRTHHARVRLPDVEAEPALGGEAAHDERVAHRGEVLAPHGELRLAVR